MKSTSTIKQPDFTFERYPRGGYILWLRENFHEVTTEDEFGNEQTSWVYDEYTIFMSEPLSNEFIEQHFNEYITEALNKEAMEPNRRISAAEEAIDDLKTDSSERIEFLEDCLLEMSQIVYADD